MFRVCVDTGGTFTDCVVMDGNGLLHEFKAPSTPWDFSVGVLDALGQAAKGLALSFEDFVAGTKLIVHGTTAATNALVTRRVAKTAMITTEGFRDIIEIRRSLKIETHSMYEAFIPPYEPLIPRRLRRTVSERTRPSGEIVTPVDEAELRTICAELKRDGIEALTICFINAYANAENEMRAASICQDALGEEVFVTYSCEILGKLGEYERASTSVISACLGPIVRTYLGNLERSLEQAGFAGQLLVMQANQFAQSVAAVGRKPAYLMGSGPAAAPAGALRLGELIGETNLITADMGGTTLDIGVLTNGVVNLSAGQWLGDDRLGLKVVEVRSIGAGGGGIGWIDTLGLLKVGPQSSGAVPGPACFGKGGSEPTITDAAVVLGYVPADYFWDGQMRLDVEAAHSAIAKIAEPLGLSVEAAAEAMFEIVSATMGDGTAEITTRRGHDVRDYALLAIGGAGPLFGAFIGDKLGMDRVIVPRFSASFSAWSMFSLDVGRDYLRSYPALFDEADPDRIEEHFASMREEAIADLAALNVAEEEIVFERSLDIRYQGQYHELEIALGKGEFSSADIAAITDQFHARHKEIFTFDLRQVPLMLRNLRLIAKVPSRRFDIAPIAKGTPDATGALKRSRSAVFGGQRLDTPVYDHAKLAAGNSFPGPALIEEPTTTIVIPPGFDCTIDAYGNYLINRRRT